MLGWGREKKETHEPERKPVMPESRAMPPPAAATAPSPAIPSQPSPPTKTLEDLLLETGTISEEQLQKAKEKQAREGGFLGQILVDMQCIGDDSLTSFLAKHCRIPHLSLLDYLIDENLLKLVPKDICEKYCVLPIDRLGRNLTVAMVNPLDAKALEAVRKACPDLRIKPILCAYNHYQTVSQKLFNPEARKSSSLSMTSLGLLSPKAKTEKPPAISEPEPPPALEPAAEPESKPEPVPLQPPSPSLRETTTAPPTPTPVEAKPLMDSDMLLDTLFGQAPAVSMNRPPSPAPVAPVAATAPAAPAMSSTNMDSSLIIREMLSVMQDSMYDTYAVLARRMDLFHGLAAADVAKIFAKGVTREFETGEVIFRKGDAGAELYVILSGKVEIRDNGRVLALLDKGDMFGEMALGGDQTRSATATAADTTSALVLSNDIIHNVLGKEAALRILENIVITLSARLRAANERIAHSEAGGA
ncbi:MAG TPA: cyclic nucleotide-binding domain-containing protein [Candidatus Hydrogenedentes bacterium]|nr:cyclic nucleotide-binding domain-containing protein [Candidatus Hydrogenedentota bacterium]HOV74115.1 cyclic nucleotide-binding domain-containing protein [Candidatus Hydrogenedentota bacterium]HPC15899.1 cyclic nucleotide-binding domain-containing protein [Candidatus Hydrogenedentota bacterium]HRT19853.1 cyclic nucleotide-binding domain-containing protein [Candidatus Hydrogenedentota bacterium]HRT65433.1 cyclic nucleotide-binding domain-containing protein [Candidatus Hydrogenedentota bacteri